MVKLAKIKVSKLQKRLSGELPKPKNHRNVRATTITPNQPVSAKDPFSKLQEPTPPTPHIIYMSRSEIEQFDVGNTPVVSLLHGGFHNPNFTGKMLRIPFEVGDAGEKEAEKLINFLADIRGTDRIIVHCMYGEQRSRAVAGAINRILNALEDTDYPSYHYASGKYRLDARCWGGGDAESFRAICRAFPKQGRDVYQKRLSEIKAVECVEVQ